MRAHMPRYYIGLYQSHIDLATATGAAIDADGHPIATGEFHWWSPDWHPNDPNLPAGATLIKPSSVIFIIARDPEATPHPHWRAMPHVQSMRPVKATMSTAPAGQPEKRAALLAAWAQNVVPVTDTDTTWSLIEKLHEKKGNFLP